MTKCQRHNRSLAVAFMDIDGLKEINVIDDKHSHKVGDDLLIEVSQRIKAALQESADADRIICCTVQAIYSA
ncbi:MAG: diguanylate cyclase (GGDEF)-like protein [Paraglaciecola sp.]|jgi:diguanylate cyclase (GGDEF)-like protein